MRWVWNSPILTNAMGVELFYPPVQLLDKKSGEGQTGDVQIWQKRGA
jgi:hypothetical protein